MSDRAPSVDFTRRAAAQTAAVTLWWRENRPLAPDALREELEQALQLIALQPEIGARHETSNSPASGGYS